MTEWHQMNGSNALETLGTDATTGLSDAEANQRLTQTGRNELTETRVRSPWLVLLDQLKSLLVMMLLGAALISLLLRDYIDAIAIAAIVLLNALLGFTQEYRAEKTIAALKSFTVPSVKVRRGGSLQQISASLLVPGDIVLLETGNLVPADCLVLESTNLRTQEAALSGESQPVDKNNSAIESADTALGDRHNRTFMGTFIVAGHGLAVVTETGMRTQLGRIAGIVSGLDRKTTPLQQRLGHLAKRLVGIAGFLVALIFVLGWLRGEDLKLLFLTSVSIGVAAIPEGLPAAVTIALALGARRMLGRNALIRNLSAVETLGSVSIICSDKTGTLTENRMTVAIVQLADRKLELPGIDNDEENHYSAEPVDSGLFLLLLGGALCNDATMQQSFADAGKTTILGDPTEAALLVAAHRFGVNKDQLELELPRVDEVSFTSERKRMTTVHRIATAKSNLLRRLPFIDRDNVGTLAFTKGSTDVLLGLCNRVWLNGNGEPLSQSWRDRLELAHDAMASKGMRILGVAFQSLEASSPPDQAGGLEQNLIFVGMFGMIDPPRPEAESAVRTCKAAGIRPVMITGDHALTARYIASQLGIYEADESCVTGLQLSRFSPAELDQAVYSTQVYARVSPEDKLTIVESLQKRGDIVAMTGDGVNDAPALKKADIGVAMGITGTDVAKEAADIVLLDDNFATLVAAVREGRVIYDNIRKFIKYILATNSGELWVMLISPFLGMPLALLPLQILWMNLMTDGLPALALAVEPAEADTMSRDPYPPGESIFARGLGRHVVWLGLLMGFLSLGIGYSYWRLADPKWQTMIFTTLTFSQMAHALAVRSEQRSLFRIGLWSNPLLVAAVSVVIAFQGLLIYVPFARKLFQTQALNTLDLSITVIASAIVFMTVELEKRFARRRKGLA
jgi:Ca2+-transporting ATPase